MPLVEVLNTTSHATPGWTYVPDTGVDPSQAALTSTTTGRKRGIREPGGRTDLTSRQNTAIIRHLAELDRENHRDVQIPIPTKKDAPKDAAGRGVYPSICHFLICGILIVISFPNQNNAQRPPHPAVAKDVQKLPRR